MAAQSIVEAFTPAGSEGRRDYRCRACSYGIVASDLPADGCPMCHSAGWDTTANRPTDKRPTLVRGARD